MTCRAEVVTEQRATLSFQSDFKVIAPLSEFSVADVKAEPMIFSGDREFSRRHGGPITQAFLSHLPDKDFIIDS